jgi:hypothetical protein
MPHHLPNVAATEEQLRLVEAFIREPLDAQYRAFLAAAGGWRGFYHTSDLFGPEELMGNSLGSYAAEKLSWVEPVALDEAGLRREDLLPIAATRVDLDLFVVTRQSAKNPGQVIWIAGGVVARFTDFVHYFDAMVDFNRDTIELV